MKFYPAGFSPSELREKRWKEFMEQYRLANNGDYYIISGDFGHLEDMQVYLNHMPGIPMDNINITIE